MPTLTRLELIGPRYGSIRQPHDVTNFPKPTLEAGPGLPAIVASIELTETGGGEQQVRIGRMSRNRPHRALDLSWKLDLFPMPAVVAAAHQAPPGAGGAIAIGQEHDPAMIGARNDGARVIGWGIDRDLLPALAVVGAEMETPIGRREHAPAAVIADGQTVNVLRVHSLLGLVPGDTAVGAAPGAVEPTPAQARRGSTGSKMICVKRDSSCWSRFRQSQDRAGARCGRDLPSGTSPRIGCRPELRPDCAERTQSP